jgi:bifunctional ADP-heptose synthase (sugar kinase/adenylyltransferase)
MVGDQVSAVVTDRIIAEIAACAKQHGLLTVADSRKRSGSFHGFDIVVPNDREAGIGAGIDVVDKASMHAAGKALLKSARNAMVTCGPDGITIFAEDGAITEVPILPCEVVDVVIL